MDRRTPTSSMVERLLISRVRKKTRVMKNLMKKLIGQHDANERLFQN